MKTYTITGFKAHALQILGQVAETKEPILVTKHGRPLAEVIPISQSSPVAGKLSSALVHEGDIVSPLDESMWDAST